MFDVLLIGSLLQRSLLILTGGAQKCFVCRTRGVTQYYVTLYYFKNCVQGVTKRLDILDDCSHNSNQLSTKKRRKICHSSLIGGVAAKIPL